MSIKKDINYALILLTIQEIDNSFDDNEYNNELYDNDDLIKEILLVLSSSHYLTSRNHVIKSQH